jgi:hypothetical protein
VVADYPIGPSIDIRLESKKRLPLGPVLGRNELTQISLPLFDDGHKRV